MSTTYSKNGTVIAFDRLGDGVPVILVQPAFGHRSFNPEMAQLAQLLAPSFTVFNYDRRGRGESGDRQPYAVEREIEDLDALIAVAGGSAYVYGMSSGAALALEAANRGLAIGKLALYEPPFIIDEGGPAVPADFSARLAELVASGRRGEAVEYFMTTIGTPAEIVAQMRALPMWPAFEAVAHTLAYDAAIMGDTQRGKPVPADRIAGVKVSTLVIVGSAAFDWARRSAQALAESLPAGRLQSLEGQFHAVPPALLAPALTEFFAPAGRGGN